LDQIGFSYDEIKKIDALRYSIFSKTKIYGNMHLKGRISEVGSGANYLKDEFKAVKRFA